MSVTQCPAKESLAGLMVTANLPPFACDGLRTVSRRPSTNRVICVMFREVIATVNGPRLDPLAPRSVSRVGGPGFTSPDVTVTGFDVSVSGATPCAAPVTVASLTYGVELTRTWMHVNVVEEPGNTATSPGPPAIVPASQCVSVNFDSVSGVVSVFFWTI